MNSSKVILILILIFSGLTSVYSQTKENLIVLVKYKVLPGKESNAVIELKKLIGHVKEEPHYVSVILHVDPLNTSNILLYEKWSDETYYKGDHLKTKHLQQFMVDSRAFLSGPPEITFWNIVD